MKSLGLSFFTDIHLTIIGLIIFVSAFLMLILLQSKQYSGKFGQKIANLPFEGDQHES